MKKLTMALFMLAFLVNSAFAFSLASLFGGDVKLSNEVTQLKDSVSKQYSDIQAGIVGNKTGLNDILNKMNAQNNEIGVIKDNYLKLSAQMEANANALIGMNNNVSKIEARDVTQNSGNTNTNDSGLMKYIFQVLSGIFLAIISALGTVVKMQGKLITQLTDDNNKMAENRDADYDKLVAFQSNMLKDLIKSKEDYKSKFFDAITEK